MNSFFQWVSVARSWSYESFKKLHHISPRVQSHLKRVYMTLCCALGVSVVGAYLLILMNVRGILSIYGGIAGIVWLYCTPPREERKRFGILMGIALLEGASGGALLNREIVDPSILVTVFVGTAIVSGCFTAAATVAKRRAYLYLGGMLSSGISILMWFRFASLIFGQSAAMFNGELYFMLVPCLVFVVFHTKEIIERAHLGDLDYVKHALTLFVDFFGLTVRLIVFQLNNSSYEREEEEKKKISQSCCQSQTDQKCSLPFKKTI